ncbi:helicase swr1 [Phyllosticta capitalensis]|uniref:Helicase swr1 n=1 Tax=Phyllosticta capitalensis TaxID=121624 RepID=A0ABR1YGY6_9PEZI
MQNTPALDERNDTAHDASDSLDTTPQPTLACSTIRNGAADDNFSSDTGSAPSGRPSKRRKLDDSARSSRPPSPPWKKIEAEGPTSFVVDGRRRSGRMNAPPPEDVDTRRSTRKAVLQKSTPISTPAKSKALQNGHRSTPSSAPSAKQSRPQSASKAKANVPAPSPVRTSPRRPKTAQTSPPSQSQASNKKARVSSTAAPPATGTRKSGRISEAAAASRAPYSVPSANDTNGYPTMDGSAESISMTSPRAPRLRLKLGPIQLPYLHPHNALPQPKYSSFAEWVQNDDPLVGDDFARMTDEQIEEEAQLRLRIIEASAPGGVLNEQRCSVLAADAEEEPPPTYGPWNHIATHASHFQKLLAKEHALHVAQARRLAYDCREVWQARQEAKWAKQEAERPKTKEEIEALEKDYAGRRYKQLVRDLNQQWQNVKVEVDRRRQERWLEEQEALGKQTMKSLLNRSTALLKERRNRAGSAQSSDDEDFESFMDEDDEGETESRLDSTRPASSLADAMDEGSDQSSDSENMSETDEEEEAAAPEDDEANMTQEQLRAKYANLQSLPFEEEAEEDGDEDDSGEEEDEEEEEPGLASILTNGDAAPEKHLSNGNSQGPEAKSPQDIDPATIELEEVDEILMDDDDDDDGSGTEMDSESDDGSMMDDDEGSASEDEEDGLGMMGFLSAQEIAELKKKAAEDIEGPSGVEVEAATEMPLGTDAKEQPEEMKTNGDISEPKENGHVEEPSAMDLDNAIDAADSAQAKAQQQSRPDTNGVKEAVEDVQSKEKEIPGTEDEIEEITPSLKTPVPSLFRGTLRPYQHEGLDWLAGLYEGDTNGILADEMGLGKTIQTIALLAHLAVEREVWGPHLVVVPTSVMLNWEMEFKKFCPGFKVLAYYGSIEERKRKRQGWMNDDMWNVVITSYQLILHDAAAFKKRSWHYLILDEAHNIKNFQTQRWQTLLNFKTHKRLLLTGTPLQNNLQELWSLLFFLMPSGDDGQGGFAALSNFTTAMARPANQILDQGRQELDAEAQATVKQLHEVLRPYLLRRLKVDVEKQMPAKYEHVVYCRLSKRQRQLYDGFMGRADTREILSGGNYMSIMNCLMSLRKVCNHPDLFETRQIVTSFAMERSVVADFEVNDLLVRKRLLEEKDAEKLDLDFLNLIIPSKESTSSVVTRRIQTIQATRPLEGLIERQTRRLKRTTGIEGQSLNSIHNHLEQTSHRSTLEHFQNCLHVTRRRAQRSPVYGSGLIDRLTVHDFPQQLIASRAPRKKQNHLEWYMSTPLAWQDMVQTLEERSEAMTTAVQKFSCVTPAAVANDMPLLTLGEEGVGMVRASRDFKRPDPFHESRIRLSIAFPDKRLLQFDCGKLQRLEKLLRELQAGGHRALIFTQMTKVLDVLEQFLNIHGHRYLRLDGATKIEQRQILTDRFNNDPRILCFILSSRSGGLGINLTGADTVIFYDLDWNPAMDKQCQDRCHRIGQTRDVHIYRFVSEYTIEANILRKSNQKRLLDDVIIQKGDFTTDYFNRLTYKDALDEIPEAEDADASAAMDRVLGNMGGPDASGMGPVLEGIEDKEDAEAAKLAQKEIVHEVHIDDDDFNEAGSRPSATPKASVPPTPGAEQDADDDDDDELVHVDEYMVRFGEWEMKDIPLGPPPDKRRRNRKGQEHRVRRRR